MNKDWLNKHPGKKKEYCKKNILRRQNNFRYRLRKNVSGMINKRLKRRLTGKNNKSTFDFIPYTLEQLIRHLESKFQKGMSWDNYGYYGWHIDHIRPDSSFNYKSAKDEEFQECWALKNFQPLWAKDNLIKHNKIYE